MYKYTYTYHNIASILTLSEFKLIEFFDQIKSSIGLPIESSLNDQLIPHSSPQDQPQIVLIHHIVENSNILVINNKVLDRTWTD